jgi:hypothetical protein
MKIKTFNLSKTKIRLLGDYAPGKSKTVMNISESINILNFEGPLFNIKNKNFFLRQKAGPSIYNLSSPCFKIPGVAILANNHLFDFGNKGYLNTKKILDKNNWLTVGAGLTRKLASKPIQFKWYDKNVVILARCEAQFGIAEEKKPGVASFDPTIYEQIRKFKKKKNVIIISYHGAAELFPWPSPSRQKLFRSFIDAGASIVHGHHSHIPQGWEKYNNGTIFYGLGNFCVEPKKWSWHPNGLWSFSPEISYENAKIKIRPKTMVIENIVKKIKVRESTKYEKYKHFEYIKICNKPLKNPIFLEGLWQEASIRMYNDYYSRWLEFNSSKKRNIYQIFKNLIKMFFCKLLRKKTGSINQKIHKYLLHYHLFICDSHKEAISTALGLLGGELKDFRSKKTKKMVDKWMINKS